MSRLLRLALAGPELQSEDVVYLWRVHDPPGVRHQFLVLLVHARWCTRAGSQKSPDRNLRLPGVMETIRFTTDPLL